MSLNRITPPAILQATNFEYNLPPVDQYPIGEHLSLYALNAGTQPVISFEIFIPKIIKNENDVAVSKSVTAQLKSGTSTKSALQISEAIEQVGANLSVSQNNDYFILKLQCLTRHFNNLLPLLFEIISDAQFPESELEIYRQQAIQHLSINLKKSEFVANRTIDELIFGIDHPYGSYAVIADYEKLSRADLLAYYKQHIHLEKATFFLSGKFENDIIDSIKKELEPLAQNNTPPIKPSLIEKPTAEKKHRIITDEKALQGAIRIANKFIEREHPDFIPMQFVNTLFGGYFGSRLMSNIREEKGYTYGIYSFIQQNKESNSYTIATDCGKDVAELAVQEVWNEMKLLQTELVDDDELQLVKNYILGGILGSLDGPFKIMGRWKSIILNGTDASRFDSNIKIYKTITAENVQELANRYYNQEDFYDLIVY